MGSRAIRARLLASSIIGGAALLAMAAPVSAQETAVEEIIITGSRIPQANQVSISPVQTVGAQEVQLGGRPQTIDILNTLPQVTQNPGVDLGPTSDPLSGPGGVSTVNLRGLGPQRTLVLIDGRRLGPGDPNTGNPNPAPDINQIPSQLIERVEVLTGGASSVYGSDAVAGVVNFILKKNFSGVQIDAQTGVYQHSQNNGAMQDLLRSNNIAVPGSKWDGRSYDVSVLMGMNSENGKGNVTGFLTFSRQEPVNQGARDYSACQLDPTDTGGYACGGSSNSNIFYFADGSLLDLNGDGVPDADAAGVRGNQFVAYGTGAATTPPAVFNSNPYMYLIQDNTRYTGGFLANYEVNDHLEFYSSFNMMQSESNVNIAPSAAFQGSGVTSSGGFEVNCNNPFLSAQQRSALLCTAGDIASGATKDLYIGRRNIEGGPRNSFYDHTNYRIVGGARGQIAGSWRYDAYGSFYKTTLDTRVENYLSLQRIQDALLVGGTAANPTCLSGTSGCIPWNIFNDGGVTPEAASSLTILGTSTGTTTQRILEASVTGDLGDYGVRSPFADEGVGVAFGVSNRRDHLQFAPDAASESGDLSGAGGASTRIDNSLSVTEGFAEVRAPLVAAMPFAEELLFEAGYRYSDYSTGIDAKTYKVGFQWAPVEDIRFRGSYNKALRAPNILELYTPVSVTNTSDVESDPCAGATPTASQTACANTGVTAAQYGRIPQCPANQCAVLTGGNTQLQPEEAKTVTVGFTTRPRFLPGFNGSIDYYRIKIDDVIGTVPLQIILDRCLATGDAQFCSQVVRNPSNGTIFGTTVGARGYINGQSVNVASQLNEGVDFQANYRLPLADWGVDNIGGLSFDFSGSLLTKQENESLPGDPTYDCSGYFGPTCGTLYPKWRHNLRANWTTPWTDSATISLAWRYWGGTDYENLSGDAGLTGAPDPFISKIDAVNYFDLSGIWKVNNMFSVRGGVNNIFDEDPPLVPSPIAGGGLPNTYPLYDLLGRRLFLGVTATF